MSGSVGLYFLEFLAKIGWQAREVYPFDSVDDDGESVALLDGSAVFGTCEPSSFSRAS